MRRPFRRGEAAAYYGSILDAQRRSGVSLPQFATARDLNLATLRRWRRELAAAPAKRAGAELVAVDVLDEARTPATSDGFEVRLPSGVVLFVPRRFDDAALRRLLEALAS